MQCDRHNIAAQLEVLVPVLQGTMTVVSWASACLPDAGPSGNINGDDAAVDALQLKKSCVLCGGTMNLFPAAI